jgi:hypothetical protein
MEFLQQRSKERRATPQGLRAGPDVPALLCLSQVARAVLRAHSLVFGGGLWLENPAGARNKGRPAPE